MKILVYNKDHPKLNTGYAKSLNELWIKQLSKKHSVGIYETVPNTAFYDKIGAVPIFTGTTAADTVGGEDSLLRIYRDFGAELYFTECDFTVFNKTFDFAREKKIKWLAWLPIDYDPIPEFVFEKLKNVSNIIPMCKSAQKMLKPLKNIKDFVYHGVDTSVFRPLGTSKAEIRKRLAPQLVSEDEFLIIMVQKNATNKAYEEQLQGIKQFIDKNPELKVKIYVHALSTGQFDLFALINSLGLDKNCAFADSYRYMHCLYTEKDLALFYNLADVCLNASAEGFGLPTLEAMACGTPAIGLNWGASKELLEITPRLRVKVGSHKISSRGFRKPFPDAEDIAEKLAIVAKRGSGKYSKKVRRHAEKFSWGAAAEGINRIISS